MTTTYAKEYADNSHIWMTPAKEYAEKLHTLGFTFEDYAAEHPHTAESVWGDDLKAHLQLLAEMVETFIPVVEFVDGSTTELWEHQSTDREQVQEHCHSLFDAAWKQGRVNTGKPSDVHTTSVKVVKYTKDEYAALLNEMEEQQQLEETLNQSEEDTMNDNKLNEYAEMIAQEAFELVTVEGRPDYEAEDFICESVDGSEWVIYYYKAHQVCQNCNTDQGAQWMDDCGVKGDSYDDYATKLAYGELYCRASQLLTQKLEEVEYEAV